MFTGCCLHGQTINYKMAYMSTALYIYNGPIGTIHLLSVCMLHEYSLAYIASPFSANPKNGLAMQDQNIL